MGGITLKNLPPQRIEGLQEVRLREHEKAPAGPMVGVTLYNAKTGAFLAETYRPILPLTKMREGQTLVVPDPKQRRLLLIRFGKIELRRRPDF